jgi:hypothetical protein
MSTDAEYEAIVREMAIARCDLVEDAREVVSNAKELTNWRHYVREYPWLFAGTAFFVGYALIPSIQRSQHAPAATNGSNGSTNRSTPPPTAKSSSWTSAAVALASSAALRLAVSYAGQQLEKWLESQQDSKSSPGVSQQFTKSPKRHVDQHAATY